MKNKLILLFDMKLYTTTKHNEIYKCSECVMIVNRVTGLIKIKRNF